MWKVALRSKELETGLGGGKQSTYDAIRGKDKGSTEEHGSN